MINIHMPLGFTLCLFRMGLLFPPGWLANTWNILEIGIIYNDLQQNSLVFSSLLNWSFVRVVKSTKWKSGVIWRTGIHAQHSYTVNCKRKSTVLASQSWTSMCIEALCSGYSNHLTMKSTFFSWGLWQDVECIICKRKQAQSLPTV